MSQRFYPLTITDIRRETDDAISIAFEPPRDARQHFTFTPGQYLTLRALVGEEEVRRSYSICSGLDDGELRVAIKRVPNGLFSHHAHVKRPGDTLEAMPPLGRFAEAALRDEAAPAYLAFAAGSGITPIMSLIRTTLQRHRSSRVTLVYGNRTSGSIMFKDALEDLKDRYVSRFAIHHVLSREKQDVPLLNGRIDAAKAATFLKLAGGAQAITAAFLCGPLEMMNAASGSLTAQGLAQVKIHREVFSLGEAPPQRTPIINDTRDGNAGNTIPLAVRIDGVTHEISMTPKETVLEAALKHGLDLPYSCSAGMCCTCRARLIKGEAVMRQNFSLEPWEMAAGFVLTCQAVPASANIAVDFDAV